MKSLFLILGIALCSSEALAANVVQIMNPVSVYVKGTQFGGNDQLAVLGPVSKLLDAKTLLAIASARAACSQAAYDAMWNAKTFVISGEASCVDSTSAVLSHAKTGVNFVGNVCTYSGAPSCKTQ